MQLNNCNFLCFFKFLPLILTQSWAHFLLFGALMGYFWGWGRVRKLFWVLLMQLNNFHFLYFFQFQGNFLCFWALMGYFWCWGRVQKLFWGLLIQTNNFCFLSVALFLLHHVVLSSCGWWWWVSDYLVSTQVQLWLFVVGVVVVLGL